MFSSYRATDDDDVGGNSSDECCLCGKVWQEGQQGWVLCDTDGCDSTVCVQCTTTLSLIVSELFYCPLCAGTGISAAASAGAAVTSAVAACTELEKLPLSFKATQKILSNLITFPEELKYRKLRLSNKRVKELVDFEPVLNILTSVGFVRRQCPRDQKTQHDAETITPTEEVLILDGDVPMSQIRDLLDILESLTKQHEVTEQFGKNTRDGGKRKADDDTEPVDDAKKHRR